MLGYGEATSNAYYGQTIEHLGEVLGTVRPTLDAWDLQDNDLEPGTLWDRLHTGPLKNEPFAHCALDQAMWDLWSRLRGKPLWQMWGLDPSDCPTSNFTIGIDDIDVMVAKLHEMPGWPCYKIKLGTDHDVETIQRLRQETAATFRVDANCGWLPEQVVPLARQLQPLGVEFIEQPLAAEQWDAMKRIYAESPLPLAADESCQIPSDVPKCQDHFHIINIKLVKCGGLTPARRMIESARQLGLKTMVGCMTESTIGISAIAQLLPMLDYVDMDGASLLREDIATGVTVACGVCELNQTPGLGTALTKEGRAV